MAAKSCFPDYHPPELYSPPGLVPYLAIPSLSLLSPPELPAHNKATLTSLKHPHPLSPVSIVSTAASSALQVQAIAFTMPAKIVAALALALCASSAVAQTNYSDVDIGALDIGLKSMYHVLWSTVHCGSYRACIAQC